MSPQLKIIKGLTALFGGRSRIARMVAAGTLAHAVGKAARRSIRLPRGFSCCKKEMN